MSPEETIRFRSFDGVHLEGNLCAPPTGSPNGIVVLVHGVTATRHESGFYDRISRSFADAGFASFRFDWRCHGFDSSRPMNQLTLAGVYNDIDAAVAVARQRVPGCPLSLVAASFSGGVTTAWAYNNPRDIRAVLLLNPVLDYVDEYIESQRLGDRTQLTDEAASTLANAGEIVSQRKPFTRAAINEMRAIQVRPHPEVDYWVLHGDIDTGVNIKTSKSFKQNFPQTKLLVFPGAEHGFSEPGDPTLTSEKTLANHQVVIQELLSVLQTGGPAGSLPLWEE